MPFPCNERPWNLIFITYSIVWATDISKMRHNLELLICCSCKWIDKRSWKSYADESFSPNFVLKGDLSTNIIPKTWILPTSNKWTNYHFVKNRLLLELNLIHVIALIQNISMYIFQFYKKSIVHKKKYCHRRLFFMNGIY